MESVEINASLREGTGKKVTRKLRADGLIPATLYGPEHDPINLQVTDDTMIQVFRGHRGGSFLVKLQIDQDAPVMTIIRERQRHPVSGKLVHLDFQRISMDKPIHASVPVRIVGEAPGVKDLGGILEHVLRQLEVSCLPTEIPEEIVVDISEMQMNEAIHVSDLDLPHLDFVTDLERTIVSVAAPRVVAEAEEEETAEGEELAEGEEAEGDEEAKGDAAAEGDEAKDKS